jgi:hypothetical protein
MAFLGKHKGKRIRLSHAISHGDILAIINSVFRGLLFVIRTDCRPGITDRGILKKGLLEFQ